MAKYNWWRRYKKKAPLQKKDALRGKSFLLQQIEHGDYDPSDYYLQALDELRRAKKEQAQITAAWTAGPESLKDRLDKIERKYIKRYNKLMEDHMNEENRLLQLLRSRLVSEFGMDVWHEAIKADPNQDTLGLYHNYRKIVQTKQKENVTEN
jgi:aromatic ring hydroxylase